MDDKFLKSYDPQKTEDRIYELWEKSEFFNPDNLPDDHKDPYCIIMPPPNANGSLHVGHALFVTIQDILIRFERMRGKRTLWYPGADHAGFETQVVYEKKLSKEGRSRFQMERKELYDEILNFTLENKSSMENQLRKLGASCDWSRELFTLDDRVIKTVYDTFKKLDDDNLLYRGKRTVNWCPKHQTSLSNLEVDHQERTGSFYYFQYGPFVIGTARPETKFGDKYVVMHPNDNRYSQYKHSQKIELEWINGPITATVIKDDAGDPEMGSGVMTITPCHSSVDFEIAKRHSLEYEQIIDWRGKLLPIAKEFEGMPITEARSKIVEKLDKKGLLVKIDKKYVHQVPVCYKCNREIEPQVKDQWFIKMTPLAEKAKKAVEGKQITFVTKQHKRIFLHWLDNIHDWNISRQIVWGIPIPAKLCRACNKGFVDINDEIKKCPDCSGKIEKDPDTFDTWFSSGQWPLVTLNYPDGDDFKTFYPTDVMETGADILFFWVARMVMFGLYLTGEVPFKTVYLHGLVNDKDGKKMSKSKGNVINPTDITDEHGTDALRMALIVGNTPGTDTNISIDKIRGYKKFANKLWNISRFVLSNTEDLDFSKNISLSTEDKKIVNEVNSLAHDVTREIENFSLHLATEKLYHYVWHTFADKIIESVKPRIESEGGDKESAQYTLYYVLSTILKLLHPFMPFVTEEIWQHIPHKDRDILMIEKWPNASS